MSNGYQKKTITWYQLWKRLGKQPLCKTRNTKVQVLINGELKECALVFTNNGSDFHLQILENLHSVQEIENTNCQIKQLIGFDVFELKELFASGWKLVPPNYENKENNLIGDWIQYQMKHK